MKYKVINICTNEDVTNKYPWVITPNGNLYYLDGGDLTGDFDAEYIIEGIYLPNDKIPEKDEYYLDMSETSAAYVNGWNDCLEEILERSK